MLIVPDFILLVQHLRNKETVILRYEGYFALPKAEIIYSNFRTLYTFYKEA